MRAITGLLNLISTGISIWVCVWVYFDARKIGIKKISRENPGGKSIMNMGPLGWAICCFLFWVVLFPIYLIKRHGLQKRFQTGMPPVIPATVSNPGKKMSKWKIVCLVFLAVIAAFILLGTIGMFIPNQSPNSVTDSSSNSTSQDESNKLQKTVETIMSDMKKSPLQAVVTR
jgi:hypothetical protein